MQIALLHLLTGVSLEVTVTGEQMKRTQYLFPRLGFHFCPPAPK